MQTPTLPDVLSTRLGADYIEEPFAFFVGATDSPDDFTGCSIIGGIYLDGALVLDLSSESGRTTIVNTPAQVNIAVAAADMTPLGTGTFKVSLSLVTPTPQTQDLLNYSLKVAGP